MLVVLKVQYTALWNHCGCSGLPNTMQAAQAAVVYNWPCVCHVTKTQFKLIRVPGDSGQKTSGNFQFLLFIELLPENGSNGFLHPKRKESKPFTLIIKKEKLSNSYGRSLPLEETTLSTPWN